MQNNTCWLCFFLGNEPLFEFLEFIILHRSPLFLLLLPILRSKVCNEIKICFIFKMVQKKNFTIYPVLKNWRDTVWKVSLIDPWYLIFEKYVENAGIERKILPVRVLPWANKSDELAYSIVSLFYCFVFYNFMNICKTSIVVFLREWKISFPLLSCKKTQKLIKLTW